jgi:hypothetical protein
MHSKMVLQDWSSFVLFIPVQLNSSSFIYSLFCQHSVLVFLPPFLLYPILFPSLCPLSISVYFFLLLPSPPPSPTYYPEAEKCWSKCASLPTLSQSIPVGESFPSSPSPHPPPPPVLCELT